jgi:aspartate/methionine/tyrosine aminotransferase
MVIILSKTALPVRAAEMPPFIVMDVLERAQEMEARGKSIIHMEIGEPDFDTPLPVKEAAIRAITAGDTHYTSNPGKIELREAIAAHYKSKYNVEVSPDRILVTAGYLPWNVAGFFSANGTGRGNYSA